MKKLPTSSEPLLLNADLCIFERTAGGLLRFSYEGNVHEEALLFRSFPFSEPDRYISVRSQGGDEIGLIPDTAQLPPASRGVVENELRLRYLIPRVTGIKRIKQRTSGWLWEFQTQFGPEQLILPNLHEHLIRQGEDRLLLTDSGGRRVEIASIVSLDGDSQKELRKVL
ncbi:DUF1854 domain-containing protein [Paenibacillus lutrae]|uniref:DUF1854 domain-containing protein n=1 Tax=Paenibacillus lutrae TaxID=2078573 RepID=A0A7X3JZ24_9BACL|nr:DUF1854 domain-containing protein [Paenibacillus lutrae]